MNKQKETPAEKYFPTDGEHISTEKVLLGSPKEGSYVLWDSLARTVYFSGPEYEGIPSWTFLERKEPPTLSELYDYIEEMSSLSPAER